MTLHIEICWNLFTLKTQFLKREAFTSSDEITQADRVRTQTVYTRTVNSEKVNDDIDKCQY